MQIEVTFEQKDICSLISICSYEIKWALSKIFEKESENERAPETASEWKPGSCLLRWRWGNTDVGWNKLEILLAT